MIRYVRSALGGLLLALSALELAAPAAKGQAIEGAPLLGSNFAPASPRGFGDRNNSWAQSMIWWKDNLYVGTSRQSVCTSLAGLYQYVGAIFGTGFVDTYLPYPPRDPDLSCAGDWADLSLQAEIWRWSPRTSTWLRVYQSPATLDNPGPGGGSPPRAGKKVPYEIAFRGFAPFTDVNGEALYAFGINSTVLWDRTKLPPPQILRSTDGITWTPVPQAPGTFLHDLPFNPDHSSFRSPVSFNGKLFALSGPIFGQGSLIASANPSVGNDSWFLASVPGQLFYELAVFNGWLYLGGFDPSSGYAIYKTRAEGSPPYPLITVVPPGAYLTVRPSKSVVSMQPYYGRLFVGTATFTEVIRINPDDTWDLVVGSPRVAPMPGGGSELKYPTSNLDAGFGHTLNDHAWQMDDPYRYLYIGTYNASTSSRLDPVNGPLLTHNMGAHMYRTPDSWYFSPVTTNGFSSASDPYGGKFDYGFRTMASTPYGAFVGTANDYYGLMIFRANKRASPLVDAPYRLEIEQTRTGGALLSWQFSIRARSYRILRAEIRQILVRDDVNFEGWNGVTGNKIPDTYVTPYQQIGVTQTSSFVDTTIQPGKRYMYEIVGEGQTGAVSEPSNLVTFPLLAPTMTFTELLAQVDRLDQRQRFLAPDTHGTNVRNLVTSARTAAAACQLATAITQLAPSQTSRAAAAPETTDLEVVLSKMVRRLQLYPQYGQQMITSEFCTTPAR